MILLSDYSEILEWEETQIPSKNQVTYSDGEKGEDYKESVLSIRNKMDSDLGPDTSLPLLLNGSSNSLSSRILCRSHGPSASPGPYVHDGTRT